MGVVTGLIVRNDWKEVDRGVNGQPFLWRKTAESRYLMIDIFNPNLAKRSYSVISYSEDPYINEAQGEVVGIGYASESDTAWSAAYEAARKIADEYMDKT